MPVDRESENQIDKGNGPHQEVYYEIAEHVGYSQAEFRLLILRLLTRYLENAATSPNRDSREERTKAFFRHVENQFLSEEELRGITQELRNKFRTNRPLKNKSKRPKRTNS